MKFNTATGAPVQLEEAIESWTDTGGDNLAGVRVHYNGGSYMGEIVLRGDVLVIDGWITAERRDNHKEVWINLAQVTWLEPM